MKCGHAFLKYLLFGFNFIFWVLGIAVFGVGVYSRLKEANYESLLGDGGILSASNILVAAGVLIALIGFVGCCGAVKESKFLLGIYFILVLLIFILEIAAGALAYNKKDLMKKELAKNLKQVVSTNYGAPDPDTAQKGLVKALDWFQKEVKCCGFESPTDWDNSQWKQDNVNGSAIAPASCCISQTVGCNNNNGTIFKRGCMNAGSEFVKKHMFVVGGAGVGIGIIQIFVMIAAVMLCRSIGKDENAA